MVSSNSLSQKKVKTPFIVVELTKCLARKQMVKAISFTMKQGRTNKGAQSKLRR